MKTRYSSYKGKVRAVSALVMSLATVTATGAVAADKLCDFAVYTSNGTTLQDRVRSLDAVGSAKDVAVGADSLVATLLQSGQNVLLRERAVVVGSVVAAGDVTRQNGVVVTGTISDHTPVAPYTIPTKSVPYGTTDVNVWPNGTRTLPPGNYRDVHVYSGARFTLQSGVYNFRSFILEAGTYALFMDAIDAPIDVNVQGRLSFGDRTDVVIYANNNPNLVNFYTNYTGQTVVGTDSFMNGSITAPYGTIVVYSRTLVEGGLYAKQVQVEPDVQLEAADCLPECAYECYVDLLTNVTDCGGIVTPIEAPFDRKAVLSADLNGYTEMTVTADICDPEDWVLNIGNSPSNNGAGGDSGDFSNDSEMEIFAPNLSVYGNDYYGSPSPLFSIPDFVTAGSCRTAELTVSDGRLVIADPANVVDSEYLFRLNQPDDEGSPDAMVYVGLNRTIADPGRSGIGVEFAQICIR